MREGKRRLLLVDEDPVARLTIDRQLDTLGWEAFGTDSGVEAERILELVPIVFEAVLIGLPLPDLDLAAFCARVMALAPAAHLLFLVPSGHPEVPPGRYVLKPCSTSALAAALAMIYPR